MAAKCNACGKFLSPSSAEGITCPKCKKCSHRACVGVSRDFQVNKSWACTECVAKLPKGNNLNTPIKCVDESYDDSDLVTGSLGTVISKHSTEGGEERLSESLKTEIFTQMRQICDELKEDFGRKLRAVSEDIRAFKQEIVVLRGKMEEYEEDINKLENRIEMLENKSTTVGDVECGNAVQRLESTVMQLKSDLNDRDQELLLNDLDLTGIAESNAENTTHVIITCFSKLGVSLEERDLVSCARVGAIRENKDGTKRPRPIAVRLARRATRDDILKAARVRRTVTTEGVGVPGEPQPFYVNERLTRFNRGLFNRTRRARKHADWKYAWTKDGKIFVRRSFGAPLHRIRSEADLEAVFGPDTVRALDANTTSA